MRVCVGWVLLLVLHGLAEGKTEKKPIRASSGKNNMMSLSDPVTVISRLIAAHCNLSKHVETAVEGALEHLSTRMAKENEQLEIIRVKLAKERAELAVERDDWNQKIDILELIHGKLAEERNELTKEKNALANKRLELCQKRRKLPKMEARSAKRPKTPTGSANKQNNTDGKKSHHQNAVNDSYHWSYTPKNPFWELVPGKPRQTEDLKAPSNRQHINPSKTKTSYKRPPFQLPAVQPPLNQEVSADENAHFQNCSNRVLSSLKEGKSLLWKIENIFLGVGKDHGILAVPIKLVKLIYSTAKNILTDLLFASLKLVKFLFFDIYRDAAKMMYRAVRNMIHLLTKLTNWTFDSAIGHVKPLPTVNGIGPCGGQWPCQRTINCKSGCHKPLVVKNKHD